MMTPEGKKKKRGTRKTVPDADLRRLKARISRELAGLRRPPLRRQSVEGFRREILRIYEQVGLPHYLIETARQEIDREIDGANFLFEGGDPAPARRSIERLDESLRQSEGISRLLDRLERLENLSFTDGLTGLFNYRYFQIRLRQEILRTRRYFSPFSLLLIDIDHFKRVNDDYGHLVGDHFLRELSRLFVANSREIDQVFRYGGEEFSLILPRTRTQDAFVLAERLRLKVAGQVFPVLETGLSITISAGISTYHGDPASDGSALVNRADHALYQAKTRGRNTIYLEPQPEETDRRETALTPEERKHLVPRK